MTAEDVAHTRLRVLLAELRDQLPRPTVERIVLAELDAMPRRKS